MLLYYYYYVITLWEWPTTNIHIPTFTDDINCCKSLYEHIIKISHTFLHYVEGLCGKKECLRVGIDLIFKSETVIGSGLGEYGFPLPMSVLSHVPPVSHSQCPWIFFNTVDLPLVEVLYWVSRLYSFTLHQRLNAVSYTFRKVKSKFSSLLVIDHDSLPYMKTG